MADEQEFDWDVANISHLARHGISPREAEQAILDPKAIMIEIQHGDEERIKAVGLTGSGRIVVVVFAFRGESIRPVTGYDAPVGIQQLYLEEEPI